MRQMKGGIMYNQRDIVLVPFPYTDLTATKRRPALIISNSLINKSEDRICCLITSNSNNRGTLISANEFESGKLPFKSWIKPNRLFSVNEKIIVKRLCTIKKELHKRVILEINKFLNLED